MVDERSLEALVVRDVQTVYEYPGHLRAVPRDELSRLRHLATAGRRWVARRHGQWAEAAVRRGSLEKMLRGESHEGIFELKRRRGRDQRFSDDLELIMRVPPGRIEDDLARSEPKAAGDQTEAKPESIDQTVPRGLPGEC
jgi:hypothetical protein